MSTHRALGLAAFGLLALAACSQGDRPAPPDAPAASGDGGQADAGLPDGPPFGDVTALVFDRRGAPVAGAKVVFHDPDGSPVATVTTDEGGRAGHAIHPGGAVTLVETDSYLVSAIDLPVGALVRLPSSQMASEPVSMLTIQPVLPIYPIVPTGSFDQSSGSVWIPCANDAVYESPAIVSFDGPSPAFLITTSCLAADGTYSIEGVIRSNDKTYRIHRSRIPGDDIAPVMPGWEEVPDQALRRYLGAGTLWTVASIESQPASDAHYLATVRRGNELAIASPVLDDELVISATAKTIGGSATVRVHEPAPHPAGATLDLEAQRTRSPRSVQIASDGVRPALTWDEVGPGSPARFLVAHFSWTIAVPNRPALSGTWWVVSPGRAGTLTYPTLPSELQPIAEPPFDPQSTYWSENADVYFVDDSGAASYGDFLADDPLRTVQNRPSPTGSRTERWSHGSSTAGSNTPPPTVITMTSDPPAVDGIVRVAVGQTVRFSAQVEGHDQDIVSWSTDPSDFSQRTPASDGNTATVPISIPGAIFSVSAADSYSSSNQATIFVQTVSPPCLHAWPPVRSTDPASAIAQGTHALALRRDGTPIVAFVSSADVGFGQPYVSVLAWDGAGWADLDGSTKLSNAIGTAGYDLALAVDADDAPVLAYIDEGGALAVRRFTADAWTAITAPLIAEGLFGYRFLLDANGDPVVATVQGAYLDELDIWVYRWKNGAWVGRIAYSQSKDVSYQLTVTSLALDGDRPVVTFEAGSGSLPYPRAARLDDQAVDLGIIDDDATAYAMPNPLVYVPVSDQPAVVYFDRNGTGPDAAVTLRASQRNARGWSPIGQTFTLTSAAPADAIVWEPASGATFVAVNGAAPNTAEVRSLDDGTLVCAAIGDNEKPFGPVDMTHVNLVADPTGGFVVAMENIGIVNSVIYDSDSILVAKVTP